MTFYEVKDSASWAVARQAAQPGDVIRLSDNISLPGDNGIPTGVTCDLNTFTVTFPGKRGFALYSDATLMNGTVQGALWGAYTGKATQNVTVKNVWFKDTTGAALKFASESIYETSGITIENVKATMAGRPTTIFDFGPGPTSNAVIRNCYLKGIANPVNNTACDGIAIEKGLTTPTIIENVTIDGVGGDGCDVKGIAHIRNMLVLNAVRNSMKLWRGGICERVACVGSGAGAVVTWPTTFKDCYFEGGTSGGAALHVDDQGIGAPDSTFIGCAFTRKPESAGAYLLVCDSTAKVDFTDCRFWNGPLSDPYHHTVFYHGDSEMVLATNGKLTGAWPACMTGSVYEDTAAPEGVGYGGTVEPPVDPPPPPVDTEPPKPGLFEVTGATDTTITLEVGPGTDNVGVVERLLRVFAEPEMSGLVLETSLGADTQYTVSGMVPDTQYYFVGTWIDAAGNYVNAQCVGRTLPAAPPPPPEEYATKAYVDALRADSLEYAKAQSEWKRACVEQMDALEGRIDDLYAKIKHQDDRTAALSAAVENSTNSYKMFRDRLRSAVGGEE